MQIYGKVESPQDIRRINCIIRDEMLIVENEAQLSELKKRSDYLCTLTYSPFWKKKFKEEIEKLREVALEENRITTKTANLIAKYKGFEKEYKPWKSEIEIDLKELPQEVIEEIVESSVSLKLGIEILEQLRGYFCEIRAAMVVCEEEECLVKLKRSSDLLSALIYLEEFQKHFDEGLLGAIDSLLNKEKERTVTLANIIAIVRGWDLHFEPLNEEDLKDEEVIKRVFQEEQKAQTLIPTTAKYKDGGTTLWIIYYHPKRKREYAKRVYLPKEYRNFKMEGPGEFKNRFGNKVWGVKISYESYVEPTTLHLGSKELHLPARWVKREKVIPLPKEAQNVRVSKERPKVALNIA